MVIKIRDRDKILSILRSKMLIQLKTVKGWRIAKANKNEVNNVFI